MNGAIENAINRSPRPMSVQAQVRNRASRQPRRRPTKASSARIAVKKSTAAVGMANSCEIPDNRFGTSRPRPRARNKPRVCRELERPRPDHEVCNRRPDDEKPEELSDKGGKRFHFYLRSLITGFFQRSNGQLRKLLKPSRFILALPRRL